MRSVCLNLKDSMQVKILSKSLIKPSSPTPEHLQNYNLSFFDQVADRAHMPLVLLYPHNSNNSINMEQELEESLSRVLTHVYPMAGRFTEDESSVLCLDQGVTYIKATVNCKLVDFLAQAREDLDLALSFWPDGIMDVDDTNIFITPLMIVQVTKFECGGLALSTSCTHIAIDGFTTFTFAYEWAKVCKLGIPSKEINFTSFNLGNLFPTRDLSKILEPPVDEGKRILSKLIARRFVFDEAAISKLREQFSTAIDCGALSFKPSRVEMITALLWRSLIRASCERSGHLKRTIMSFPLNLRGKVTFPDVANSFGNFIIEIPIKFEPDETKMELHHFVKLIRDSVQQTSSTCAKATPDEIVCLVVNLYKDSYAGLEWGGDNEVENFTISSLCRFPIQKADFGWGNPSLIHFGSRHSQVFWLNDTECETGIAVQMDLQETYMNFFEHDHDILAFAKF
ncbi:acetyl-CoA-benzylalcohol acetyltransferase-like [Nicotiana tomentosiformis]|uniref:acetyl-CoA-benzylalcohol acetyltransferase-like n=1 Tax=Nicotiana tomentosiformis TaxID=4098 RepID=UPI00051C6A1A|nr:acetyl-CoA-benzylalcohol acetyltransferase-like [Nicotiana tomentosiformis]